MSFSMHVCMWVFSSLFFFLCVASFHFSIMICEFCTCSKIASHSAIVSIHRLQSAKIHFICMYILYAFTCMVYISVFVFFYFFFLNPSLYERRDCLKFIIVVIIARTKPHSHFSQIKWIFYCYLAISVMKYQQWMSRTSPWKWATLVQHSFNYPVTFWSIDHFVAGNSQCYTVLSRFSNIISFDLKRLINKSTRVREFRLVVFFFFFEKGGDFATRPCRTVMLTIRTACDDHGVFFTPTISYGGKLLS